MTARLTRLRIAGFKSFPDATTLEILPGMTGIVGPNGCGKSNVVEALRWAMGENSARSMRGGEMDDVIFGGTGARAARNLAEVAITLESPLPAPFDAEPEVQVSRRIERGSGSAYRANGRELRARDVQTLFADLASGARSSGMVSQGRVAALVGAKPEERRLVLEEAAGITGLHARRHEAELKLRAAEQNLARAEDLRATLEVNRDGLQRQARQAARYRALSGLVRAAEAELCAVLLGRAAAAAAAAREGFAAARAAGEAADLAAVAAAEAAEAAELGVAGPRRAEAEARGALERLRIEAEGFAAAEAEARLALEAAQRRLADALGDLEHARRAEADAASVCAGLEAEAWSLAARRESLPTEIEAARAAMTAGAAALREAEAAADVAAAKLAADAALRQLAGRELEEAEARLGAAETRRVEAERRLGECLAGIPAESELVAAESARRSAVVDLEAAEAAARDAARALAAAREGARGAELAAADAAAARRGAEAEREEAAARAARAVQAHGSLTAAWQAAVTARVDPDVLAAAERADQEALSGLAAAEAGLREAEANRAAAADAAAAAARVAADAAALAARAEAAQVAAADTLARVTAEHAALSTRRDAAQAVQVSAETVAQSRAAEAAAEQVFAGAALALQRLVEGHATARAAAAAARRAEDEAVAELTRRDAEIEGLTAALGGENAAETALLDALIVPPGLELAMGAALGDALGAGLDVDAPHHWRSLPEIAALPGPVGCRSLAGLVEAPAALGRALGACFLLAPGQDGDVLQVLLSAGQSLVTREGRVWRWDGQVRLEAALPLGAQRLALRGRLAAATGERHAAAWRCEVAREVAGRALADEASASGFEAAARAARDRAEAALRQARDAASGEAIRAEAAARALAEILPALGAVEAARSAAEAAHAACLSACGELGSPDSLSAAAGTAACRVEAAVAAEKAARERLLLARDAAAASAATLHRLSSEDAEARAACGFISPQLEPAAAEAAAASAALEAAEARLAGVAELAPLQAASAAALVASEAAGQRLAVAVARHGEVELALRHASALVERVTAARQAGEAGRLTLEAAALRAGTEGADARTVVNEARSRCAALPDRAALLASVEAVRARVEGLRETATEQRQVFAALQATAEADARREGAIGAEMMLWAARLAEAASRLDNLVARHSSATAEVEILAGRPAEIAEGRARAAAASNQAAVAHATAAEALAAAEQLQVTRRDTARARERQLGLAREALVRAEGGIEHAEAALEAAARRVEERLGVAPELPEIADLSELAETRAAKKFERLTRERDEMGPVNLRAEIEVAELEGRMAAIETEREEITTAIARLRGAIGHLNREGRERLAAVFTEVDRHFRALFGRVMGGGRAHLALTGSDDPLEAGLEIYAEPPGKKLSSLSLLSGGEQALTALSLIFAIFRCNPAPVAVLDEVDAPLDDANVERFCTLLEDMVRHTGTRFLVVTHHQLTMSRMDRLYGVTMEERGVSRILSVDLARAAAMAA